MHQDTQTITNPGPDVLPVCIEPWGMVHLLAPGASFRMVAASAQPGQLEVVESEGSVTVYSWAGSTLQLYQDDELVEDFSTVVPGLPPGMSTKDFVGFMFGGPDG
jgi:hypothetical protein